MPEPFIPTADVSNTIKNILEHYPVVDGPIRELLQNSDDAGATRQVFVLDQRNHPISSLAGSEYIGYQQSPSLIAYNDAYFEDRDWNSLKRIFDSSKAQDVNAFGQFGQGFRCVYHLTDCPQIFSGHKLALLNLPQGITLDMKDEEDAKKASHIAAFQGVPGVSYSGTFLPSTTSSSKKSAFPPLPTTASNEKGKRKENEKDHPHMNGTLIRLPLRSRSSSLSIKCHTPQNILKLFNDFFSDDLECILLFLKNIKKIEMYEISPQGTVREICSASVKEGAREGLQGVEGDGSGGDFVTWRCIIETRVSTSSPSGHPTPSISTTPVRPAGSVGASIGRTGGATMNITTTTWRILSCPFTDAPSIEVLKRIPKEDSPEEEMRRRKLDQKVRVAAPLSFVTSTSVPTSASVSTSPSVTDKSFSAAAAAPTNVSAPGITAFGIGYWRRGRLFNGLPLPRSNNQSWPIHVDAKFALQPSRQRIRSFHEGGFIGEWNMMLFAAFIPQAWTFLLNVLAREDKVKDIFEYWPPPGGPGEFNAPAGKSYTAGSRTGNTGTGIASRSGPRCASGSERPQGMLQTVFDCVIIAKPAVWPVYVAVSPPPPSTATRMINSLTQPTHVSTRSTTPLPHNAPVVQTLLSTPPPLPEFAELGNLKIAREDVHFPDLRNALADCGIRFTKPPVHFKTLIEGSKIRQFQCLEPENVHEGLLGNVSRLEKAISSTPRHANAILDFLLKGQDIRLLLGLPLLKNVDGQYITLQTLASPASTASAKQTLHPLLDVQSAPLFRTYDSNAIALHELSRLIATGLEEKGPGNLNVVKLTPEKVIEYLSSDPRWTTAPSPPPPPSTPTSPTPASLTPPESTQWLGKFYKWLAVQPFASNFLKIPRVRELHIIPTQLGLKRVEDPVFNMMSATLVKCLRALGVGLLDPTVGFAAKAFLAGAGDVLRKDEDVKGILDGAIISAGAATATTSVTPSPTSLGLTCLEWKPLIDFIVRHAQADQLGEEQRRKLRSLPIYPLLDPFDTTHSPRPGAIPENKIVHGVTSVDLLPIIDGCVYFDLRGYSAGSYGILHFLSPTPSSNERPLTSDELLALGVRNFGSQPPEVRGTIVTYVVKHEKSVSRETLERLWEMSFIVCRDGVVRRPGEVVDPTSTSGLGGILSACVGVDDVDGGKVFDEYLPRMESESDKEIVHGLKKLPLSPLKTSLDQVMLLKISAWISRNMRQAAAAEASRRLLKFLATNPGYGEVVEAIPRDHKWIPTNGGLKARHECRDRNTQYALFDEVYALVDDDIQVTDVLRDVLGWTQKLTHENLFDQLDATLKKGGEYTKIREIVEAIGSDNVSQDHLERLYGMLEGREWVPTKTGSLVKPEDAVLAHGMEEAGFYEVSFNEVAYPGVVAFLRHMGIKDRPTTDAILARIEEPAPDPLTAEQALRIVKLLERLPVNLDDDSKARLLVPGIDGLLHPVSDLHFNDTGSSRERLPRNIKPLAHPYVSETLARTLDIEPLASKLSTFSGYMGESFATSIQKVLVDYNETQMLLEMLANAVDAGAKHFVLILDETPLPSENLISPDLAIFQQCPALLVYNDAEFTEEDFEGLCSTGEGSKAHKRKSIGQFGRGALTMFHVTEFPMIASTTHALFIDPSRRYLHLPGNANNQGMKRHTLADYYPHHLDFLEGLSDCLGQPGNDIRSFAGTIFRLPLREASHIEHGSPISNTLWRTNDVQERLLAEFKAIAGSCFLFTKLERICAYTRNREGVLKESWSLQAIPAASEMDGNYSRRMVQIQGNRDQLELWQTVSHFVPKEDIPEFASSVIEKLNLRDPKVELAAFIRPEGANYQDYHEKSVLFSTMPLTEATGLPVHCSATFITTSDRRHIRLQLDNDPGNQAKYNVWLLEEIVPPLYLYLLEILVTTDGTPNQHFWPINDLTPTDRMVIPALYERHLKNSDKRLFESAYDSALRLTPNDVVILPERSPIEPVVDLLSPRNVAKYSEPFLSRVTDDAGLPPVSPSFLREYIVNNSTRLAQAFLPAVDGGEPQLSADVLDDLLAFFLEGDPELLLDLQLLPLENKTLVTITRSSSGPTYYVWNLQINPDQLLANPSRLVKLDFHANVLLDRGFNVEELKSASIASLIEERFPKQASIDASQEQRDFIHNFWANFQLLRLEVKDILGFPLVPTLSPNRFISLNSCKHGNVPIVPTLIDDFVCQCLSTLGVPLVRRSTLHCPPPLSRILENRVDFPDFKMKNILGALEDLNPQLLITRFHNLGDDRVQFSDWIRRHLFHDVPRNVRYTARTLPVWRARDGTGIHDYVAAEQLVMLPEGIDEGIVAPYITQQQIAVIPQNQAQILRPALMTLEVQGLSFRHLLAAIKTGLPPSMPLPAERQTYKELVEVILERMPDLQDGLEELRLPDAFDFTLRPVQQFYANEEPLFRAALLPNHPKFVSPEFRSLEHRLPLLKRLQDIDMEIFAECVQSIANDSNDDGGTLASHVLNDRLPVILGKLGPDAHRWELINDVEFIPRFTEGVWRPGVGTEIDAGDAGLDVSQYVERRFGDLVAPRDIVREEDVGIAWSQRALPARPLTESLIRAFPTLGRPSVDDVIAHLRVLVTRVAHNHANHPAIIPDLVATYKYLDDRADESADQLSQLRDEMLFLNVDDENEDWAWESAGTLSFDSRDVGHFKSVRWFLHRYRDLLVSAGAQEVNHPQIPGTLTTTTPNVQLDTRVQRKYNEMRRNGRLVDVEFITRDHDPDHPLVAHRSFLAAVSDYLMDMFCGGFIESGPASPDNPVHVGMAEYSRDCVSFVLDYIYGSMDLESAQIQVLLNGLRLAQYWSMPELVELIQDCIIRKRMVNPETLADVTRVAAEENCTRLMDVCEAYRRDNAMYISQFQA